MLLSRALIASAASGRHAKALVAGVLISGAQAQGPPSLPLADAEPGPPDWLQLGASAIGEWTRVVDGGLRRNDEWRSLLTIEAEIDLAGALGEPGLGVLFASAQTIRAERGGTLDAGDFQVYSNLETDETRDDVMEAGYEQLFWGARARLKLGKIDANGDFALVECAGDFSHSSAGFSPSVVLFPSYPDPAGAVNLFVELGSPWEGATSTLGYGLFDGSLADGVRTGRRGISSLYRDALSDAHFHVLQWEAREAGDSGDLRISLGAWHHTGDLARFDGGESSGTGGAYLTLEQGLQPDALDGRQLHLFAQAGWADEAISDVGLHLGAGAVLGAPFASREADSAGLYASFADLSDEFGSPYGTNELALDLYYRWTHSETLWIQPEVQLIVDPGGSRTISNALILGLRIGAEF